MLTEEGWPVVGQGKYPNSQHGQAGCAGASPKFCSAALQNFGVPGTLDENRARLLVENMIDLDKQFLNPAQDARRPWWRKNRRDIKNEVLDKEEIKLIESIEN